MGIKYYPNRVYKRQVPAIDRVLAKRSTQKVSGTHLLTATALSEVIYANADWQINSIALQFSAATARNYSFKIKSGRVVVDNLNDSLWFQTSTTNPQNITLTPGFYSGTQLGAMLKVQMDNNQAFTDAGLTFNIVYTVATGLYSISPSSGVLRYLNVNTAQTLPNRDSIAGHLFGLNVDTSLAASVTSDTVVAGLDAETAFITQTGSTVLDHYHDDTHTMDVDDALLIEVGTAAALTVNWSVVYEEIV